MFEATQSEVVYTKNTEEESRNFCKSEDGSWIRNMAAYLQIKSCFLTTSVVVCVWLSCTARLLSRLPPLSLSCSCQIAVPH